MKRILVGIAALAIISASLTGCKGSESVASITPATPTPVPTPVYEPHPLTGVEKPDDYKDIRPAAVMVNNITNARPQRGLSEAKVLYEIVVEGGITRFCALYENHETMPTVGPVRSARDQFFRLIMPYQPVYAHVGGSAINETFMKDANFMEFDINGSYDNLIYRDSARQGYALEHTAYTNSELMTNIIEKNEIDMEHEVTSPIFNFVNYNEDNRVLGGSSALEVEVRHSQSYRTSFDYNTESNRYDMSQYSSYNGVTPTIDENNDEQVAFDNVFVLFTDISLYPYPGGNPKGDPGYKDVDYDYGGIGYYINGGQCEEIRWTKGPTTEALRYNDLDGNVLEVNPGTSYVGVAPLDEHDNFEVIGAEPVATSSSSSASEVG